MLVDDWVAHGATSKSGSITLAAGTAYDIVMEYFNNTAGGSAQLSWTPPGESSVVIPNSNLLLPGPGMLAVSGGTLSLNAASTYMGGTVVKGGDLQAEVAGALGSGNVTVTNGGALEVFSSAGIASSADVILGTASVTLWDNSTPDAVHALSLDSGNTYQPSGTYGSASSSAAHKLAVFSAAGLGILNVTAGPSGSALSSSASSAVYGNSLSLTSTITGSGATPTGSVTFYDNGNFLGKAALDGSGVAVLSVANLLVATSPHTIKAVYSGDVNYATSSLTTTITITKGTTQDNLVSSSNPSITGASVTFTATLSAVPPAGSTPTGSVIFATNGVALSTNIMVAGVASTSTSALQSGNTTVAAWYVGDSNFVGVTNTLTQLVGPPCSQTNALLSIVQGAGNSFTLNFKGTPQSQYYILAGTNAAQPLATWQPVPGSTNTAATGTGLWSATVTNPAPAFYRSKAISVCP